jgi:hypothetical protein
MAAAAGEVEKDCEEMEVRLWMVRNALFEGRKDNIVKRETSNTSQQSDTGPRVVELLGGKKGMTPSWAIFQLVRFSFLRLTSEIGLWQCCDWRSGALAGKELPAWRGLKNLNPSQGPDSGRPRGTVVEQGQAHEQSGDTTSL